MYKVIITKTALKQLSDLERSGSPGWKRAIAILEELRVHPRLGIGKPERLRYQQLEMWSRRLDKVNCLTYSIEDDTVRVEVLSVLGHYDDK